MNNRKSSSLNELYEFLKPFHLSDSLYLIGSLNAAMKYGFRELYKENIPKYLLVWLGRNLDSAAAFARMSITLSRLARFLLLSGSNDYRSKVLTPGTAQFSAAINMVGDLSDDGFTNDFSSDLGVSEVLGRLVQVQFPLQADRLTVIGRAYLLFVVLPRQVKDSYDFDGKMKEFFGIGSYEFMATGMAQWLKCNGVLDYELKIEIDHLATIVTTNSQKIFLSLSAGLPEDYRRGVRGDAWKTMNKAKDSYALDPFVRIPAIKVDRSSSLRSDSYVVPQSKYLLDRASTGIFYLLADREQEIALSLGKNGQNRFRHAFGDIYREYVGKLLNPKDMESSLIDLDKDEMLEVPSGVKIPDFALIEGHTCVLFEIKTSLLKVEARTYFEEHVLRSEVQGGSFYKAIHQLKQFSDAIVTKRIPDQRFAPVTRVINVMIGYEDIFVLNSSLLPLIDEYYPEISGNLQLGTVSDVDVMGNALAWNKGLGTLLEAKIDDKGFRTWSLATYLTRDIGNDQPNDILRSAFNEFWSSLVNS